MRELMEILSLYPLQNPMGTLLRHNENETYRISDASAVYVLRIHRPVDGFSIGYFQVLDRYAMVESELRILEALHDAGRVPVQKPVRGINGALVQVLADGTPISMLKWIEGQIVEEAPPTANLYLRIGETVARLHREFYENSAVFGGLTRYPYDQSILAPMAERIQAAKGFGVLNEEQAAHILAAIKMIGDRLDTLDGEEEKQLVHADLSKSNMLVNQAEEIVPIDFSLSGYSHRYMDLGGLFGHILAIADREQILQGYESVWGKAAALHSIEPYYVL